MAPQNQLHLGQGLSKNFALRVCGLAGRYAYRFSTLELHQVHTQMPFDHRQYDLVHRYLYLKLIVARCHLCTLPSIGSRADDTLSGEMLAPSSLTGCSSSRGSWRFRAMRSK